MTQRETLEARLPQLKTAYRERMQSHLAADKTPSTKLVTLREFHAAGLEYFNAIDRVISLGALDRSETNPTWFSGMAETAINALETILNHYRTVRNESVRLGMSRDAFTPSRTAYSQIQRIAKLHDKKTADEYEAKYIEEQLPVYGFQKEESVKLTHQEKRIGTTTGIAFLIILVVLALFVPNPTSFQEFVFRVLLGLSGAAFASVISGFLTVEGKTQRFAIRAGAGFAVFVIIYAINPPRLLSRDALPHQGGGTTLSTNAPTGEVHH